VPKITVRSVRPAPHGFRDNVAMLAAVTIVLGVEDEPIELTRYQAPKKQGEDGKEWKIGSISAGVLRLDDVPVTKWTAPSGEARYFANPNGFKLSRDCSDVIAAEARRLFSQLPKAGAPANNPPTEAHDDHQPIDSIFPEQNKPAAPTTVNRA
jgi:hypothetical protein